MSKSFCFANDYNQNLHLKLQGQIYQLNGTRLLGYGHDSVTKETIKLILNHLDEYLSESAAGYFMPNGTMANKLALRQLLMPGQGVLMPKTAHPNNHEAGSLAAAGIPIIAEPCLMGKITPEQIQDVVRHHNTDQHVFIGAVCIALPTELGTLYEPKELAEISVCCHQLDLDLYIDGARLFTVLGSPYNYNLKDIASYCDAFYIGGTKNGGDCEFLIFPDRSRTRSFPNLMKQYGALSAKTFMLAAEFKAFFTDDLYVKLGSHANLMAQKLGEQLVQCGVKFRVPVQTNQLFPMLKSSIVEQLAKKYQFYIWENLDESVKVIRLVTSHATTQGEVDEFIQNLIELL